LNLFRGLKSLKNLSIQTKHIRWDELDYIDEKIFDPLKILKLEMGYLFQNYFITKFPNLRVLKINEIDKEIKFDVLLP
jgi:hypothetical protein